MVATVTLALADLEAVDAWDAQRAEAHRQGSVFRIAGVQLWNGYTRYLRGELAEAESELRASQETLRLWGMPTESSARTPSPFLAEVLVERGAVDEARVLLDNAGSARVGSDQAILLDRARMRVLLAEGRHEKHLRGRHLNSTQAGSVTAPRSGGRSRRRRSTARPGTTGRRAGREELEIARGW
jgi:hypothetical protein